MSQKMTNDNDSNLMTFGGHLEVLRRMLFRIIAIVGIFSIIIFCCKDAVWVMLLAPSKCNFITYSLILVSDKTQKTHTC